MTYNKPIVIVNDSFSEMISAGSATSGENDTNIEFSWNEETVNAYEGACQTTFSVEMTGDTSTKDMPLVITILLDQECTGAWGTANGTVVPEGNKIIITSWSASESFTVTVVTVTPGVQISQIFIE